MREVQSPDPTASNANAPMARKFVREARRRLGDDARPLPVLGWWNHLWSTVYSEGDEQKTLRWSQVLSVGICKYE